MLLFFVACKTETKVNGFTIPDRLMHELNKSDKQF